MGCGRFSNVWSGGSKKKRSNRHRDVIVPYRTKNHWPYIMQSPIWSHGDWGQSQFQLGGDDESAHQILSYGLLFLPFYHFPSTADPPTCTMLMQPSTRLTWSPLTIHYTHCTISPAPCCRLSIWPTYHIVLFPILSSFSITQHILLQASQSQAITLHGQDLTICFTTHKPCACFTYHLYLKLLYLPWKEGSFSPRI